MEHPPKGFKYISRLGGGQATTWKAETKTGEKVVLKTLELKKVSDWKGIELFEREVRVLRQLDYPFIPKFVDFIKDEVEGAQRWHIVQEFVDGATLNAKRKWTEKDLRGLALSVLHTLVYLQSFSPPLLHRDLKPDNIIRQDKGYSLIDFGAVRHVVPSDEGGSTVVGTSGYMAPEQLMGRADKSSDLYGLGTTLIKLISGVDPGSLKKKRMQIQWSDHRQELSPEFTSFIDRLVEPHAEDRFSDAQKALNFLQTNSDAKEAIDFLERDIDPPKNLVRRGKSWVRIWTDDKAQLVKIRGRFFRLRNFNEFGPFYIFIAVLVGLMCLKSYIVISVPLAIAIGFSAFFILLGLFCFEREVISASINVLEHSEVTIKGKVPRSRFSAADSNKLEAEIEKLRERKFGGDETHTILDFDTREELGQTHPITMKKDHHE